MQQQASSTLEQQYYYPQQKHDDLLSKISDTIRMSSEVHNESVNDRDRLYKAKSMQQT